MLPVWMPERILEASASIGNVLTGLEINTALVAERVVLLKEYPFIGVMGYAAGENPFSYPELKYEKIKTFITEASRLVDFIILDCSSNMLNFFTPTAIEAADLVGHLAAGEDGAVWTAVVNRCNEEAASPCHAL